MYGQGFYSYVVLGQCTARASYSYVVLGQCTARASYSYVVLGQCTARASYSYFVLGQCTARASYSSLDSDRRPKSDMKPDRLDQRFNYSITGFAPPVVIALPVNTGVLIGCVVI